MIAVNWRCPRGGTTRTFRVAANSSGDDIELRLAGPQMSVPLVQSGRGHAVADGQLDGPGADQFEPPACPRWDWWCCCTATSEIDPAPRPYGPTVECLVLVLKDDCGPSTWDLMLGWWFGGASEPVEDGHGELSQRRCAAHHHGGDDGGRALAVNPPSVHSAKNVELGPRYAPDARGGGGGSGTTAAGSRRRPGRSATWRQGTGRGFQPRR
jgi:hypothetical protein